jgi:hypothetical protein
VLLVVGTTIANMFGEAPQDDGESEKGDGKTPDTGKSITHEDNVPRANDFILLFSSSDSTSNDDDVSATPGRQPEFSSDMGSHDTQKLTRWWRMRC